MGLTPVFKVTADGDDVTAAIAPRLIEMSITDNAGRDSDCMNLTVDNLDEKLELPRDGVELEAWIGYDNEMQNMGIFVVDDVAMEGPPTTIKISAKAAPFKASKTFGSIQTQKMRSWDNLTLGEMAQKIAQEHGLQLAIDSALADKVIGHLDQINESDIHLLTRFAGDIGATAKPAGGRLIIVPRGAGKTAQGKAIPLITIKRTDVSGFRLSLNKRARYRKVIAVYRDVAGGADVELAMGDGIPCCRLRYVYPDATAAGDAAKAKLNDYRRGAGKASMSMAGRTDLMAEGRVAFDGFPPGFDGEWQLTGVTHSVSPSGYTASIEAETLGLEEGEAPAGAAVVGGGAIDGGTLGDDEGGETIP